MPELFEVNEETFDICLTEELAKEELPNPGDRAIYGQISVEDFHETFIASWKFWDRAQYEHQWQLALKES
jgi:hypothetical protein